MVGPATDNKPTFFALLPRQIMLQSNANRLVNSKDITEDEENNTKKRKTTSKSKKGSSENHTMDSKPLLRSIASFLENNGFSRTLSAFRSEAHLELDGFKGNSLDLEAVLCKFLQSSEGIAEDSTDYPKEQAEAKCGLSDKVGGADVSNADEDPTLKKKKKKKSGLDEETNKSSKHETTLDAESEQRAQMNGFKEECKEKRRKTDADVDEMVKEHKQKKKKSKMVSGSAGEDIVVVSLENKQEETKNVVHEDQLNESPAKSKTKKKKKDRLILESSDKNIGQEDSGKLRGFVEEKLNDLKSLIEDNPSKSLHGENASNDTVPKTKDKKKRRQKSTPELLNADKTDQLDGGISQNLEDLSKSEPKKESDPVLNGSADNAKTKESKKRKRNASEGVPQVDNTVETQEPKQRTLEMSEDKENDKHKNVGNSEAGNGHDNIVANKKRKTEQQSAEPKTINAFRRVKIDEVKFSDERLQDNSYWAKDGADSGYGARAQEILGQVRGRDFRHEKTKKKRGSYRGGQIDFQSHSIKFNYSDDDE